MEETRREVTRSRWAALGAAVAVCLGAGGLLPSASADVASGDRGVLVPIPPCRIADTRPAPENVGARAGQLRPGETYVFNVRGTNGNCTIPPDAIAVVMNVAAISPSAATFLTLFPADAARPLTANLNVTANQPPLSNSVTVKLSSTGATPGQVAIYNLAGNTHFTADIVGYYAGHNHDDRYYTKAELDARLWGTSAVVLSTGGLARSSAPVTTQRLGLGLYEVDLGFDLVAGGCTFYATIGDDTTATAGPGLIDVANRFAKPSAVFVRTSTFTAGAFTPADQDFHLLVMC